MGLSMMSGRSEPRSRSLMSIWFAKEVSHDALLPEVQFWAGTNSEEV